ncbi:MAG: hypothetical protein V4603_09735, partial [Pseudomonadota bacterium]
MATLVFEPHPLPLTNFTEPTFVTVDSATSAAKAGDTSGSYAEQDAEQEALLNTALTTYGENSAEAVTAFEAYADWNLDAFLQRSSVGSDASRMNSSSLNTITQPGSPGGSAADMELARNGNPFQTTLYNLYLAKKHYLSALAVLTQQPDYSNPQLVTLERKLQKTL